MKTTIKQKALQFIGSDSNGKKRADVLYNILLNNKKLKLGDYNQFLKDLNTKWRGYYSVAFQQWEREGLIIRQKGIYKATELGKAYAQHPKMIRELNALKRKEFGRRLEIFSEFWELKKKYENLINQLDEVIMNA